MVQPVAVARDDTDLSKPNRIRIVVAEGRNREVSSREGGWQLLHAWEPALHAACSRLHLACPALPEPSPRLVLLPSPRALQVRNLCEAAGLGVKTLRRVRIGGFRLPRDLAFGQFVELRPWEVRRVLDLGADRTM